MQAQEAGKIVFHTIPQNELPWLKTGKCVIEKKKNEDRKTCQDREKVYLYFDFKCAVRIIAWASIWLWRRRNIREELTSHQISSYNTKFVLQRWPFLLNSPHFWHRGRLSRQMTYRKEMKKRSLTLIQNTVCFSSSIHAKWTPQFIHLPVGLFPTPRMPFMHVIRPEYECLTSIVHISANFSRCCFAKRIT